MDLVRGFTLLFKLNYSFKLLRRLADLTHSFVDTKLYMWHKHIFVYKIPIMSSGLHWKQKAAAFEVHCCSS